MYNDDEERKSLPIKSFLIALILIIIFVLLLVWLLPMPNLTGLNNRIFNSNIQEMKNAAIPYFTTDKLPKNEGDKVRLSLQEMIDQKLVLPFTDKNGEFVFGPLCPDREYEIQIWSDRVKHVKVCEECHMEKKDCLKGIRLEDCDDKKDPYEPQYPYPCKK